MESLSFNIEIVPADSSALMSYRCIWNGESDSLKEKFEKHYCKAEDVPKHVRRILMEYGLII